MKELLILRHAKSSWKQAELDDHDRPLNKRGLRDAPRMGHLLRAEGIVPEMILCSTAVRARATARIVAEASGFGGRLLELGELYLASPDDYVAALSEVVDDVRSVMLVGHNPGLEQLVERLSGRPARLPTAALVRFELGIARWSEAAAHPPATLRAQWNPKEIDDVG